MIESRKHILRRNRQYMKMTKNPCTRSNDIISKSLGNEFPFIYDLKNVRAFCLNETSSKVWKLCDGTSSVEEIASQLNLRSGINTSTDLVLLAVDQFARDELLVSRVQTISEHSRREMIKKTGSCFCHRTSADALDCGAKSIRRTKCWVPSTICSLPIPTTAILLFPRDMSGDKSGRRVTHPGRSRILCGSLIDWATSIRLAGPIPGMTDGDLYRSSAVLSLQFGSNLKLTPKQP